MNRIDRRTFLLQSSGLVVTACFGPRLGLAAASRSGLERIGMGTVLFRYRFPQTRPEGIAPLGGELSLLEVPQYYRERFGMRQVEFWSYHFESLERPYLRRLKAALADAGSSLVNVQVDTRYNLASADDAERRRSVDHVKEWIDAVAFLGSTAIRVNPGNGPVERSIESLREVNAYARSKGLPLLTENHFGIEMDPDVHLRLIQEAGPDNLYSLPDFGNYPSEVRFENLRKIMPHAWLISAKAAKFNENMEHISYDFDACVRLAEEEGFKGVYVVEQWSRDQSDLDFEKVADWLIDRVRSNLRDA